MMEHDPHSEDTSKVCNWWKTWKPCLANPQYAIQGMLDYDHKNIQEHTMRKLRPLFEAESSPFNACSIGALHFQGPFIKAVARWVFSCVRSYHVVPMLLPLKSSFDLLTKTVHLLEAQVAVLAVDHGELLNGPLPPLSEAVATLEPDMLAELERARAARARAEHFADGILVLGSSYF